MGILSLTLVEPPVSEPVQARAGVLCAGGVVKIEWYAVAVLATRTLRNGEPGKWVPGKMLVARDCHFTAELTTLATK